MLLRRQAPLGSPGRKLSSAPCIALESHPSYPYTPDSTLLHTRHQLQPPPTHHYRQPCLACLPPLPPQLPGIAGGFVAAYGLWSVLTKDSATKLPHTITNPEWAAATKGACMLCGDVRCAAVLAGWAQLHACRAAGAANTLPVSVASG